MKKRILSICIIGSLIIPNICMADVDSLMGYTKKNKAVMGAIWLGILGYGLKKATEDNRTPLEKCIDRCNTEYNPKYYPDSNDRCSDRCYSNN